MKKLLLVGFLLFVTYGMVYSGVLLRIISPNGGENWPIGFEQQIRWSADESITNNVKLTLWRNEVKVGLIARDLNPRQGFYTWKKVGQYQGGTAEIGSGYKIRIKEQGGTAMDESDQPFSLKIQALIATGIRDSVPWGKIQNLPDLWIYYNLPSNFQPNTTFPTVFKIGIKNLGKSGSKACTLKYTITGKRGVLNTIYLPIPAIKPGGTEIIRFQYKFTEGGPHNLIADADSANIVLESKEDNNHLSKSLDVRDDVKPDLVLVDVFWYRNTPIGNTAKVWGKVKNIGKYSSPRSKMYIICSPKKKTRTKTIHALAVGAEQSFEFGFEYWTTGTKECGIWVDSGKKIDELREDNNHLRFSFKIISGTIFD